MSLPTRLWLAARICAVERVSQAAAAALPSNCPRGGIGGCRPRCVMRHARRAPVDSFKSSVCGTRKCKPSFASGICVNVWRRSLPP
eukprot:292481-Chlamydomonas_euryale.AAC.6